MRTDLVRAAAVLGIGLVLGAGVLVVGMRWAISSAVEPHLRALQRLDATVAASARGVESAVEQGSGRLSETLEQTGGRVSDTVAATGSSLQSTVALTFERPVLIRSPEPMPISGGINVEGRADGAAVNVAATIGRQEEGN